MDGQLFTLEQFTLLGVAIAMAYIIGAATSRVAIRAFDIIMKRISRSFRFVRRVVGIETRAARSAAATAKSRGLVYQTDIDTALRVKDSTSDEPTSEYDFSLEESLLIRKGPFFQHIKIPPEGGYIPDSLTKKMSDEITNEYVREATNFFNHNVSLHANEQSLYDDAEGAVIISFFRDSDRRCFYALNEMRKTINGNIWRMAWSFSAIWFAVVATTMLCFWGESFDRSLLDEPWLLFRLVVSIVAVVFGALAIWYLQSNGYEKHQEHSARELGWFLSQWLDRINNRYRDATAHAMGVTVGEEKDSKKVAEEAKKWNKIMMWMAFRAFFVESFYRNIRFQIDRNRTYYDLAPKTALIIVAVVSVFIFWSVPAARPGDLLTWGILLMLLSTITFVFGYFYNKKVIPRELDENKWMGFKNLELSKAMDEVVGKYGEEVGYWKNRTGRD